MILKSSEIRKIDLNKPNIFLFYGKNEGFKNESINQLIENHSSILKYDQNEILETENILYENILSNSLFDEKKIIIIKRVNDKITKIIENIIPQKLIDISIILNAENLDKKSKLRSYFEKNKNYICVPFYPDTEQTLIKLCYDFLKKKNISISTANMNLIINRCLGDRYILFNELNKIDDYCKNKKKINEKDILKLTNLIDNYSISELVDNCLAKNRKKTVNILNENNFSQDETILIIRGFLNKAKKILSLSEEFSQNKNIDLTIATAKPPIFWKDKNITKQQIIHWTPNETKKLIFKISEIELQMKKNLNNSINLITNFILELSTSKTNN